MISDTKVEIKKENKYIRVFIIMHTLKETGINTAILKQNKTFCICFFIIIF